MKFLLFVIFAAFLSQTKAARKEVCYPEVGCFDNDPPFDDMPLPEDPKTMPPVYHVFVPGRKESHVITSAMELDVDHLFVFIHGLTGTYNNTAMWVQPISWNLLKANPNHQVLFVEWEKGSALGHLLDAISQPCSNARVIARVIINFLRQNPKFDAKKVHCLGFSLGTHVCGFAGKYVGGWGRISAMDPSAPYFKKEDPRARVDKSDADFVDVIHTSLTAGLQMTIGHVDFWPNGAKRQAGCVTRRRRSPDMSPYLYDITYRPQHVEGDDPELYAITDVIEGIFGCSHYRAAFLYAETIVNPDTCSFPMCPCESFWDYQRGKCNKCDPAKIQYMGYHSVNYAGRGNYYGQTSGSPPYCLNNE